MNDICVYDNFLDKELFETVSSELLGNEFPWYYQENISSKKGESLNDFGFSHVFYRSGEKVSDWVSTITPVATKVLNITNCVEIIRIRGDMTVMNQNSHMHVIHVDHYEPHITAILYLKDSDGNTVIYNEKNNEKLYEVLDKKSLTVAKEIEPKANRLVVFDGQRYHTGHSPMKNKSRVLLNFNVR